MVHEDAAAHAGGDRLSGLPDKILFRVMAHLKAWEALRTSMLSMRWRYLWASASRLDIRHPCRCAYPIHVHGRTLEFAKFVKNLLLRRRPMALLDSLRLCWSHTAPDGDANTWIAYAVRHGAEEIELSGEHHVVPPDSLEYMSFIVAGDDLAKNRLRILKLIHIQLDKTTLTQLCSRCTCLEELELKDCVIPYKTKIQPIFLARLTMIRCQIRKGLSIHAPNLVELQFSRNLWHVPWIQNLGLLAASNINQQAPQKYLEGSNLCSCNLKILKLSRVILDDTTLAQLCRCPSLEELELNGCCVAGKEIRSNSLRCLTMINCKFSIGSGVRGPNLLSLRCIRPFQQVPWFWNMEFLVAAIILLDDSCVPNDSWWTWLEDDKNETYLNDNIAVHSGAEYLGDNQGSSGPADEVDGCTLCYQEIAEKYNGACGGKFGGDGLLCSLSNVRTLDLSAHSGEVLLMRESKSCTNFKNLKILSLGEWCISPDLDVLASMLQSSPNLENLFVHLDMANKIRVGFNPQISSFTCTNLKKVEITSCKHDDIVPILAKFFDVNGITHKKIFVRRTTCTCDVKRNTGSQAKRKAQTESEKRPEKQIKPGYRGKPQLMWVR